MPTHSNVCPVEQPRPRRRSRKLVRSVEVLALVLAGLLLGAVGLVRAEHCPTAVQVRR